MDPSLNNTIHTPIDAPVYYELSWAILSSMGLCFVLLGLMVVGIVGVCCVATVPMVVSAACAVANGLCYHAYYTDYSMASKAVAGAVADVAWLVQECGLPFYSYVILKRVLYPSERRLFLPAFWALVVLIAGLRMCILIARVCFRLSGDQSRPMLDLVAHLHIGYFTLIALVECLSAAFLLRKFHGARRVGLIAALKGRLFGYLMRSTEIRLCLLAVIGVTRAITYSFQFTTAEAVDIAGQVDRFAYTLECFFPAVMYVDILASHFVFAQDCQDTTTRSRANPGLPRVPTLPNTAGPFGGIKLESAKNSREGLVRQLHAAGLSTSNVKILTESGGSSSARTGTLNVQSVGQAGVVELEEIDAETDRPEDRGQLEVRILTPGMGRGWGMTSAPREHAVADGGTHGSDVGQPDLEPHAR